MISVSPVYRLTRRIARSFASGPEVVKKQTERDSGREATRLWFETKLTLIIFLFH